MNKNPQAFPITMQWRPLPIGWNGLNHYEEHRAQIGMTLRDWFAGMALQGLASNKAVMLAANQVDESRIGAILAAASFEYADAMLAEREKQP